MTNIIFKLEDHIGYRLAMEKVQMSISFDSGVDICLRMMVVTQVNQIFAIVNIMGRFVAIADAIQRIITYR
jgi:hypothetical protein